MQVTLRFFSNERWSIRATVLTVLILIVVFALRVRMSVQVLLAASLLAMLAPMSELGHKLVFSFFLCMLMHFTSTRRPESWLSFWHTALAFALAVLLAHYVPSAVYTPFQYNSVLRLLTIASILVWMLYFGLLVVGIDIAPYVYAYIY